MDIIINGRYTLSKELGIGGMGAVYLGHDKVFGDKHVAVKLIKNELVNPTFIQSFKREFDLMTRLKHPNLISVYDFGLDKETNQYYMTMEYVDGTSLASTLSDLRAAHSPVTIPVALEYTIQLCRALEFIHSRNILHRDIKPANIMVSRDCVKVMDFGIADLREHQEHTKQKGTLLYLAPEILQGRISKKVDIYALGVTLAEMFVHDAPSIDEHSQNIISYLTDKQKHTEFIQSLLASIKDVRVTTILSKMVAYDPMQRYHSAAEIIADINREFEKNYALETEHTKESYVLGAGFVGRDQEFSTLKEFLTEDEMYCMIVYGEAGIGKSRLMAELKKYCQLNESFFIEASCFDTIKKLYTPFIALMNECLYHCTEATLQQYGPDVKKLFPHHEKLSTIQQHVYSDSKTERIMLNKSITGIIVALAYHLKYPVVLYLNDMQWIDEASLEVLTKLISQIHEKRHEVGNRIKIFLTSRREGLENIKNIQELPFVKSVCLQPFDRVGVASFIKTVFGSESVGNNLLGSIDRINHQVGGNPFYLQEMIRSLIAVDAIVHTTDFWELVCQSEHIHIPQKIGELLRSRYKRLKFNESERRVLEILSLLDREATFEELNEITTTDLDVLQKLDYYEIIKKEIIDEHLFFRMNHALIQEMVISEIVDIQSVHNYIGEKLERMYADKIDDHLYSIVHHFVNGNNKQKALQYGVTATDKALNTSEIHRASLLCDSLLRLCDSQDSTKLNLLFAKLNVYRYYSDLALMNTASVEVIQLADQLSDKKYRAQCYSILGEAYYRAELTSIKALEYFEKSLSDFTQIEDKHGIASVLNLIGAYYTSNNDFTKALEFHQQSLAIAEAIGDELIIAYNMGNIGLIHSYKGDYKQALNLNCRALSIVTKLCNKQNIAIGCMLVGRIYGDLEDYPKAVEYFDKSIALAREIELYIIETCSSQEKVKIFLNNGQIEEAEQLNKESIAFIKKWNLSGNVIYTSTLYSARIEHAKNNSFKAIEILQHVALEFTDVVHISEIKFFLWKITGDQSLCKESLSLFKDLYVKTSKNEYKKYINELEMNEVVQARHSLDQPNNALIQELNTITKLLDEIQDIFQHNDLKSQFSLHETNTFISQKISEITNKFKHLPFSNQISTVNPEYELTRIQFFQQLLDIIHDMNSNLSLNTLLDKILDASIQLMGAERGAIFLYNADGVLEYRTGRTYKREYIDKSNMTISQTIVQKVLISQKALFVPNIADDIDLSQRQSILEIELRSAMCAPLGRQKNNPMAEKRKYPFLSASQRLGILYVDSTGKGEQTNFIGSNLHLFQVLVDQASIAILNAILYESVNVDKLTGLFLRPFFEINLEHELAYCYEIKSFCSVLMIDIDFFKIINDRHGHQIGDEVLKMLGGLLKNLLRTSDISGRYGGEEFIIILPNTDIDQSAIVAHKIMRKISQTSFPCGSLTISIGISSFPQHFNGFSKDETRMKIIKNADQALYLAKHNGRNRYEVWHEAIQSLQITRSFAKEILTGNPIRDYKNVEMLLTVIHSISNIRDTDDILAQIMDLIIKSLQADRGIILINNEMTGKLEPIISRDKKGNTDNQTFNYSKKTVSAVYLTGKEVCINTIEEDVASQSITEMEIKSIMCVALHQNHKRVGVIYIDSKKQIKEFSITELSFFNAIAAQISFFLASTSTPIQKM